MRQLSIKSAWRRTDKTGRGGAQKTVQKAYGSSYFPSFADSYLLLLLLTAWNEKNCFLLDRATWHACTLFHIDLKRPFLWCLSFVGRKERPYLSEMSCRCLYQTNVVKDARSFSHPFHLALFSEDPWKPGIFDPPRASYKHHFFMPRVLTQFVINFKKSAAAETLIFKCCCCFQAATVAPEIAGRPRKWLRVDSKGDADLVMVEITSIDL